VTPELVARLAVHRIELVSEAKEFSIVVRDNCFALVHTGSSGSPGIGSSGLMTENGLAYLVWREGEAYLVAKGSDVRAAAGQVEAVRRFSEDLKQAITELATDERR
jgi:hypothetical protein